MRVRKTRVSGAPTSFRLTPEEFGVLDTLSRIHACSRSRVVGRLLAEALAEQRRDAALAEIYERVRRLEGDNGERDGD